MGKDMNVVLDKFFEALKEQEKKHGVEISFDREVIRDAKHLDCIWYGGPVGHIKYKDYKIEIGAYGDICIGGAIDGEDVYFKDKHNYGRFFEEFGGKLDDKLFYQLLDSPTEKNFLNLENSNWFEVDLYDPDGNWVDLCGMDNVLENNILDCFEDVSAYFEYVDLEIAEREADLNEIIKSADDIKNKQEPVKTIKETGLERE